MANYPVKKIVSEAKAVILDVEGTIASIDYIRKKVFPYIESHLEDYIMNDWEEVKNTLSLIQQSELDSKEISDDEVQLPSIPTSENLEEIQKCQRAVIDCVRHQMKNNSKDPAIKQIQGLVLLKGLRNLALFADIYIDAAEMLKAWFGKLKPVYTYSTGSRSAQKQYLKHTLQGDLSLLVKEFFDTSIGSKLECEGFNHICNYAKVNPSEVVFFSDSPREIVVAKISGLKAILVDRETEFSLIKEEQDFLGHEDGKIKSFFEILSGRVDQD